MAENGSIELNKFVLFCLLLLIQVAVSEIIFEERFDGIAVFFSVLFLYIYIYLFFSYIIFMCFNRYHMWVVS